MARYITPKNTITTAVFGAALAPAAALACGNSMVTYTPMTYVANVVVLGLPALFFGGIAYLLYRKQKLRALPAILFTALPTVMIAFFTIPILAMSSPFAEHESFESYDTRTWLEAAIEHQKEHGEFPGGKNYSYSNHAGPGGGVDCALALEVTKNPEFEFNTFDETPPEGKKAREVLDTFPKELRLSRRGWNNQVVYSTGPGEGEEATATITTLMVAEGYDDEPARCFLTRRAVAFDKEAGAFVRLESEQDDFELEAKKEVAEKITTGSETKDADTNPAGTDGASDEVEKETSKPLADTNTP